MKTLYLLIGAISTAPLIPNFNITIGNQTFNSQKLVDQASALNVSIGNTTITGESLVNTTSSLAGQLSNSID